MANISLNHQLQPNATARQLEQAAAFNHTQLFCINANSVGGTVHHTNGVTHTHGGKVLEAMIAFPGLTDADAGNTLDEIITYYLTNPPKGIGCWSLHPALPADLGLK